MAIKVTLRKKPIQGNQISIYMDFYPEIINSRTGKPSRREFLNLFLFNEIETELEYYKDKNGKTQKRIIPVLNKAGHPKERKLTSWDKQHNKDTWELAEKIRNRKVNEINKPLIYSELEKENLKSRKCETGNFVEYFKSLADKKNTKENATWNVVYKKMKAYTGGVLQFKDLNETFCEDFRGYILKMKAYNSEQTINQNTACTYFVKFKAGVKQAFKDKKIPTNVGMNVPTIKLLDSQRNFLTIDELNRLYKTDCLDPMLKKSFLFSALTGLRKGDILALTWNKLELIDGRYAIRYRQQKTKSIETLWISEQAYNLLGKPGKPAEKVFPGLKINSYYSKYLLLWINQAGINKKISFHCARHSAATNQLTSGTSISTVSKMLGHKNIRTTQIYAKVVDPLLQEASDRVKLDF
jgi:integrase